MNADTHPGRVRIHSGLSEGLSWPVIGHEWAVELLAQAINIGRLRHAYLITGSQGIGKRTIAIAFAQAIVCSETNAPCLECRTCTLVAQGKHPDVTSITPLVSGKLIKRDKIVIEPIRELIYHFSLRPIEAPRRVAVISDFEYATEAAANALLKTLEEPPGDGLLILTSESTDHLLSTIVSRCEHLALRPLRRGMVQRALTEGWNAPAEKAELLAHISAGRLGWAVRMVNDDDALERRFALLDDMAKILSGSRVERFSYADLLSKDREAVRDALYLWQSWWRDVLLIASGSRSPLTNIDHEAEVNAGARLLTIAQACQAVESIRTCLEQIEKNANARLALEVLMLKLPRLYSN